VSVGCCPLKELNVTVELDPAMKQRLADLGRAIEVDIVAVNPAENQRWQDYSMTKYWQPPFELKTSVQGEIFSKKLDATTTTMVLNKNDPMWAKWFATANAKGAPHLYILAQLPGTFDDQPGEKDQRRQILPLGSCRWETQDVKVLVQTDRIRTLTAYKPDKK
jgi:hypothetical protein